MLRFWNAPSKVLICVGDKKNVLHMWCYRDIPGGIKGSDFVHAH